LFSITIVWPHLTWSRSPMMRARMSLMPPPGKGTMNFTVRFGNAACAQAALAASAATNPARQAATTRIIFHPPENISGYSGLMFASLVILV
jgi:hypothetical protein